MSLNNNNFPIPKLTKKRWKELQSHLDLINKELCKLHKYLPRGNKDLEDIMLYLHVLMGLVDLDLGRTIDAEEVIKELKTCVNKNKK